MPPLGGASAFGGAAPQLVNNAPPMLVDNAPRMNRAGQQLPAPAVQGAPYGGVDVSQYGQYTGPAKTLVQQTREKAQGRKDQLRQNVQRFGSAFGDQMNIQQFMQGITGAGRDQTTGENLYNVPNYWE